MQYSLVGSGTRYTKMTYDILQNKAALESHFLRNQ